MAVRTTRRSFLPAGRRAQARAALLAAFGLALPFAVGFAGAARSGPLAMAPAARPAAAAQAPERYVYALPVMRLQDGDDVCEPWFAVQNVGRGPTIAVAAYIGGAVPGSVGDPNHSFPIAVACSGIVRPGSGWHFYGYMVGSGVDPYPTPPELHASGASPDQAPPRQGVPVGSRSALVFSLNAMTLLEAGDIDPADAGFDDMAATRVCDMLAKHAIAGPTAWRNFVQSWWTGDEWFGEPQVIGLGEPLAIQVYRQCPGGGAGSAIAASAYTAPRVPAPTTGPQRAVAPGLAVDTRAGSNERSLLHVQNVGIEPISVEVAYAATNDCTATVRAPRVARVLPGDVAVFDPAGIVPDGWHGAARVRADGPVVVAVERTLGGGAVVETLLSAPDGSAARGATDDATRTGRDLGAIFVLHPGLNDVRLTIVNAGDGSVDLWQLFGAPGTWIGKGIGTLCPGVQAERTMQLTNDTAAPAPATIRVFADGVDARIGAVVDVRPSGAGDGAPAYTRVSAGAIVTATDVAAVPPLAVPLALDSARHSGLVSEIAVARFGGAAGEMDVAVRFFDHNGLVATACRTLTSGEPERVALGSVPGVPAPYDGHALLVATAWRPAEGAEPPGGGPGALMAAALMRTFDSDDPAQPMAGDGWAAMPAIPIDAAGARFEGDAVPPCGPVREPRPGALPPDRWSPGAASATAFLPALRADSHDTVCVPSITVRLRGDAPAELVLMTFDEPGFCEPECRAVHEIQCSPLIAAGGTWTFAAGSIPAKASNGIVFSVSPAPRVPERLPPESQVTPAQLLCSDASLGDLCTAWRWFWLSWQTGRPYFKDRVEGWVGPPIEVTVHRTCPPAPDGAAREAGHPAPTMAEVAAGQTRPDRFTYSIVDLVSHTGESWSDVRRLGSVLYVQNAGLVCVSLAVTFIGQDGQATNCHIAALARGESYPLDIQDCLPPGWRGRAVVSATGPLAIVADRRRAPLSSGRALAGAEPCDVDADGYVTPADGATLAAAYGSVPGDAAWRLRADIDGSGRVDAPDRAHMDACVLDAATPTSAAVPPTVEPTVEPTPVPTVEPVPSGERGGGRLFLPYGLRTAR